MNNYYILKTSHQYNQWDKLIQKNDNYSFFHSSAWTKVIKESYHYKLLLFGEKINGNISNFCPIVEVRSILTGYRGVSLAFSDHCEPIFENRDAFVKIFESIKNYGKNKKWKFIEFRGGYQFFKSQAPYAKYYRHVLELTKNIDDLYKNLRDSNKRNIKKAQKQKVQIYIDNSLEGLKKFYRLNCLTRKLHGLPPQPFSFFKNIYYLIIRKGMGNIFIASFQKRPIASALFFSFGEKAIYKFGASDREFQKLRPNNYLMWKAIQWYAKRNYKSLDFGRTALSNSGLLQFKDGWGAKRKTIFYYRYDLQKDTFLTNGHSNGKTSSWLFNKLPIPLLRLTGEILYKHFG